ncbi:MAG TPA: hypothetical protein VFR07_03835 [Mycobacteriales bacterium]|jgi:hypothetical protein|nr:hypothetical protein [Mycobacteriales bacterium]
MGLKDMFRRSSPQAAPTRDGEPGSPSSQVDGDGDGPVTLAQRNEPGGQGSPDTNQAKTEPMPATPGHADPNAEFEPPSLDEMNVGGGDPQSPSHPAARDRDAPVATAPPERVNPGVAPQDDRPGIDPDSATKLPEGPERPAQATAGRAQRQPGSDGESPEQQETDVETGAANMRPGGGPQAVPPTSEPGDPKQVPVPHDLPAEGTSETAPIAQGIRTPDS